MTLHEKTREDLCQNVPFLRVSVVLLGSLDEVGTIVSWGDCVFRALCSGLCGHSQLSRHGGVILESSHLSHPSQPGPADFWLWLRRTFAPLPRSSFLSWHTCFE